MGSYAVFGLLALVALVRYPNAAGWDWGSGRAWGYVAFIVSVLVVGIAGVVLARRGRSLASTS